MLHNDVVQCHNNIIMRLLTSLEQLLIRTYMQCSTCTTYLVSKPTSDTCMQCSMYMYLVSSDTYVYNVCILHMYVSEVALETR